MERSKTSGGRAERENFFQNPFPFSASCPPIPGKGEGKPFLPRKTLLYLAGYREKGVLSPIGEWGHTQKERPLSRKGLPKGGLKPPVRDKAPPRKRNGPRTGEPGNREAGMPQAERRAFGASPGVQGISPDPALPLGRAPSRRGLQRAVYVHGRIGQKEYAEKRRKAWKGTREGKERSALRAARRF